MKISIVTVSYNSESLIHDALESVWRQKREDFKIDYVVVDGGSKDGTVEVIRSFDEKVKAAKDGSFVLRWISEPDKGLYDAMNKGLKMAEGDVIGICNSDDMLAADDVLAKVAEAFKRDEALEFVYSDVRFVARETKLDDLRAAKTARYICPVIWQPWMMTFGYAPPHPGQYIKKSCFERFGGYKYEYRIGADYEMNVRFLRKEGVKRRYLNKCAVAMRLGGASTEKGNAKSFVGNNYDVINANRENGYLGSKWLILGKLPMKVIEVILPRIFPHIGA